MSTHTIHSTSQRCEEEMRNTSPCTDNLFLAWDQHVCGRSTRKTFRKQGPVRRISPAQPGSDPADRPVTGQGTLQKVGSGSTDGRQGRSPVGGRPPSLPMLYRTAWNAVCGGPADPLAQNPAHSSAS